MEMTRTQINSRMWSIKVFAWRGNSFVDEVTTTGTYKVQCIKSSFNVFKIIKHLYKIHTVQELFEGERRTAFL